MTGILLWKESQEGKREKRITIQEKSILHMRAWQAEIFRGPRTPEAVLRRRVAAAEKKLRKLGVKQIVLPEGFTGTERQKGIKTVSTLALRQMLAADWVQRDLAEKGLRMSGARVAVVADRLSGEVVRTVTELALRHRYVLLELPHGGEELCRRLRKEYGISLLLGPDQAQIEEAEALVLFTPKQELTRKNPVVVALYDEEMPVPPLALPPALEDKLPRGAERVQLLAALLQAGVIRAGVDLTF